MEILETGSESELILIQNYLLDKILKEMPESTDAIERCVETSEKIMAIEQKLADLENRIQAIESKDIKLGDYDTYTYGTGSSWSVSGVYDPTITSATFMPDGGYTTATASSTITKWTD